MGLYNINTYNINFYLNKMKIKSLLVAVFAIIFAYVVIGGVATYQVSANSDDNGTVDGITDDNEVLGAESCTRDSKITGYVYNDKNKNDKKDSGENGIKDIKVEIYFDDNDNEEKVEVKTDKDGKYEVNVCAGDYKVKINDSEDKYEDVKEVKGSVGENETDKDINIGLHEKNSGSILDYWWVAALILLGVLIVGGIALFLLGSSGNKETSKKETTNK